MLINKKFSIKVFNKLELKKFLKKKDVEYNNILLEGKSLNLKNNKILLKKKIYSKYKNKRIINKKSKLFLLTKHFKYRKSFRAKGNIIYINRKYNQFLFYLKRYYFYKYKKWNIIKKKFFKYKYWYIKKNFFINRFLDYQGKYFVRNLSYEIFEKLFNKKIFEKSRKLHYRLNKNKCNKFKKFLFQFFEKHKERSYKNLFLKDFKIEIQEKKPNNEIVTKIEEKKLIKLIPFKTFNKWKEVESLKDLKFWMNSFLKFKLKLFDKGDLVKKYNALKIFYNKQPRAEIRIKSANWALYQNPKYKNYSKINNGKYLKK